MLFYNKTNIQQSKEIVVHNLTYIHIYCIVMEKDCKNKSGGRRGPNLENGILQSLKCWLIVNNEILI